MKITAYFLAAILAMAVLFSASAVPARADDGPQATGPRPIAKILERVAQILNIDKQNLLDAFMQATGEARQQNLSNNLATWVKDGKLTQAQADEYSAWLAAKPTGSAMAPKAMQTLLKDGKITQAQYDTWKAWWDKKPDVKLPLPVKPQIQGQKRPMLKQAPANIN